MRQTSTTNLVQQHSLQRLILLKDYAWPIRPHLVREVDGAGQSNLLSTPADSGRIVFTIYIKRKIGESYKQRFQLIIHESLHT